MNLRMSRVLFLLCQLLQKINLLEVNEFAVQQYEYSFKRDKVQKYPMT